MESLKKLIREVSDYPKPGVLFYDITTLLKDPVGFRQAVECVCAPYRESQIDIVVGIESRGFIFGAAVADRLGVGFVPVRKPGKLPWETVSESYELEYGVDTLEMHQDAVEPGQRVLIVDDLLATGGTARATVALIKQSAGNVVALAFLIELEGLNGRDRLKGEQVFAALRY
jgi:adenine phosphoribosyltransferase